MIRTSSIDRALRRTYRLELADLEQLLLEELR
jgi:hypothetical protein